jgi:F0F1-type ATP synthase membrane subunit b/b'
MVDYQYYQYLTNPKHWRDRAEQTLAKAQQEPRPEAKERLQKVAREYEHLAERAEQSRSSTVEQSSAQVVV